MASRPIRIGDQLVLEEDYDENYIPSEHGKRPRGCRNGSVRAVVADLIFILLMERRERARSCSVSLGYIHGWQAIAHGPHLACSLLL